MDNNNNTGIIMGSKRTYIATFWRGNPQLKNGGYYTTKEFRAVSHKAAERQAERMPFSRALARVLTTVQLEASGRSISTRCCRRVQTSEGGKYSPRDTAVAIVRLLLKTKKPLSMCRSASRE